MAARQLGPNAGPRRVPVALLTLPVSPGLWVGGQQGQQGQDLTPGGDLNGESICPPTPAPQLPGAQEG